MILDGLIQSSVPVKTSMTGGVEYSGRLRRNVQRMDTSLENTYVFSESFIKLLDVVIMRDSLNVLSKEQQELITTYFAQADILTLDGFNEQLDKFLGEYKGE